VAITFAMVLVATSGTALAIGFSSRFLARSLNLIDLFVWILMACTSAMALIVGGMLYLALARRND